MVRPTRVLAAFVLLTAFGLAPSAVASVSGWHVSMSPNTHSRRNVLYGVSALSRSDAWAVGYHGINGYTDPLIEHWNGNAWLLKASPKIHGFENELYGVSAVSDSDVWAVGRNSGNETRTLIEHWNG